MRILSLLPGATELVYKLGMSSRLVGRSHECDYPSDVQTLPACTETKYQVAFSSEETDQRIRALIREGLSVYRVNEERLKQLRPDVIITQDQCEACAVSYQEIREAVDTLLDENVELVDYSPSSLPEFYETVRDMARVFGKQQKGTEFENEMRTYFRELSDKIGEQSRPDVVILEWLDPLMSAGNWLPDLVDAAGGSCRLANPGEHAEVIDMGKLLEADPEIIILAPCGYDIEETGRHLSEVTERLRWQELKAVKTNQVYVVDGNHYFNRPGPRLKDSTRISAEIMHPEIFDPTLKNKGWIPLHEVVY